MRNDLNIDIDNRNDFNVAFDADYDDEDILESKYVPNQKKSAKRTQAAKDNQKNKWLIKD